ncbi:MAG: TetR family transcriptional regulator [Proteobacteria bacterium]|nr:TetR family transcriptional regulator [Pseudomonadota bacterium]
MAGALPHRLYFAGLLAALRHPILVVDDVVKSATIWPASLQRALMRSPMTPLPAPFSEVMPANQKRLSKRERTRRQLIVAAITVFSANGVAASTMQQIAAEAGMTTGTIYNHFRTKAEIVNAVGRSIVETVRARSAPARADIETAAEQIAAGCRRYLGLAQSSPAWALLIIDVASIDPAFRATIETFVGPEIRKGLRLGEFVLKSEAAGLDIAFGATLEGMRRIAHGEKSRTYVPALIANILRGLGVPWARAQKVASKQLPLFESKA